MTDKTYQQKLVEGLEQKQKHERLRDEFAMAALPHAIDSLGWVDEQEMKACAVACYEIADAMLKQREVKND